MTRFLTRLPNRANGLLTQITFPGIMKAKLHFLEIDDVSSILNPAGPAPHIAGTKVIATLGPACHDVDQLVELLECGMSCARIDLTVRHILASHL